MLSLTTTKPLSLFKNHHYHQNQLSYFNIPKPSPKPPQLRPITASATPPPTPQQQLYQPFRPPPSPLPPQFRSLDPNSRLEILANRLGLWFEWAPLIPSLYQEGFTAPTIEEVTGIAAVEQNRLVVGAQVRDTLHRYQMDPQILSFFDTGGAELLYELRLLSAAQRAAAAHYVVENRLDAKGAQEVARAMKDFPRRSAEQGWDCFDHASPADCLSFMYYRQSKEHRNPSPERTAALEQALNCAATEKAKGRVLQELDKKSGGEQGKAGETADAARVPVVRLKIGEVAEATTVVVLPVCRAEEEGEKGVYEAPREREVEGEFGVVVAEKGWSRWVVLPGWEPVVKLRKGGVVIAFKDARVLPWKVNRWYKEEPILVVADREKDNVAADDGFYLVLEGGGLKVERGIVLKEKGVSKCLGSVVLVARPPREETDDQLGEEDWE